MMIVLAAAVISIASCEREPVLHLYRQGGGDIKFPIVDLNLEVYWDYELIYGIIYDWRQEWHYGWDEEDQRIFGDIGYQEPNIFQLRRYYTGDQMYGPHKRPYEHLVEGTTFRAKYEWGFWDLLIWNEIETLDGVQSLIFDETTTYEYVTAYTNQTMRAAHHNVTPKYTRSFYQPEILFSAYDRGIEINRNMDGFIFDSINNVYVKTLNMTLEPITYIYLTQVILHNNRGKITGVDGSASLSGMARSTCVNDGVAGSDQITVDYNVRFKRSVLLTHSENLIDGDKYVNTYADIVGGKLTTFGMCNINANRVGRTNNRADGVTRVNDGVKHYIDVNMQFVNGTDSTFTFDVTDQVQTRYKGGVLTVELDMDTINPPTVGKPGSGFDATVEDWQDGGTHEFDMAKKRRR